MKFQLPPLAGLLAFEVAARYDNFAKAAKELNLTQSAVSHRVRMLESYLGYPLFERLPRGLKLTESGKAYLPSIRKSFEQIFSSTAGIFGRKDKGMLTIRAPVSYTALWLSPIITSFRSLYPGIQIRLTSSVWAEDLASEEIDIDFRLGFGYWPNCVSMPILTETVVPVCNPDNEALKSNQLIQLADIASQPLIHVMGIEDLWMKYFAEANISLVIKASDIHVDSAVAALEIAARSDSIALIQKRFLPAYFSTGRLCTAFNIEMEIEQGVYLVEPDSPKQIKPEAILFREWLEAKTGEAV